MTVELEKETKPNTSQFVVKYLRIIVTTYTHTIVPRYIHTHTHIYTCIHTHIHTSCTLCAYHAYTCIAISKTSRVEI